MGRLGCCRRFSAQAESSLQHAAKRLENVVVVAAKRTPIGAFQGLLSPLRAWELGAAAIKAVVEESKIDPKQVQEVYMGNVLSSGLGQAPARQAALGAGLSAKTICTTVNKVCASGMKAVMLAAQSIALGTNELVVAGGMESMSNAPFLLPRQNPSKKLMGDLTVKDSMFCDGLSDAFTNNAMGTYAESCAQEMGISREEQDVHAIVSYERAISAREAGTASAEVTPVIIAGKKGKEPVLVSIDEECSRFDPDKMRELLPVFKTDGSVTAANSSKISDGAAALLLASAEFAEKNKLPVIATIRGFADAAQPPEKFPTSPAVAIPRALAHARRKLNDVDLFEINEAFSVVTLANCKLLGISNDDVNVCGGAVALGHPIGASGARIMVSLINNLRSRDKQVGVAAVCNGGGGASAIVVERTQQVVGDKQAKSASSE
ncbi:hypothetical protein SELMODRAFT_100946 [Selaginella moellendorffii]|uniref:acetyl-CoA C-acetyltransferase n=1 Tax=Selaginella moellendorffii TaxID=88036 RepID=D8RTG8_SELML|nr:acetyl-CoA acetyltransferase, cytosolic 1 [Selaginella moellendorffii]XP_002994590.1 acetyl-CoA acetyltransferase, cytosolic 1 [Selaginella moellendorffii]EFJ04346.1 hypothetical protein SELMODRAFT_138839 [Selaginella moellendorffii]EFJ24513.1 hypothetical protein SELMODRAFT_100946 [Selaginella moellendorffii]|eukprot:XP_002974291.1 acetyl-CoA acetyltransferase, cytosolic 1 [Selaginella moellendorffii]